MSNTTADEAPISNEPCLSEQDVHSDALETEMGGPLAESGLGDSTDSSSETDGPVPVPKNNKLRASTPPTGPDRTAGSAKPRDAFDLLTEARELREKVRTLEKTAKSQVPEESSSSDSSECDNGMRYDGYEARILRQKRVFPDGVLGLDSRRKKQNLLGEDGLVMDWGDFRKRRELTFKRFVHDELDYGSDSSASSRDLFYVEEELRQLNYKNNSRLKQLRCKHEQRQARRKKKLDYLVAKECDRREEARRLKEEREREQTLLDAEEDGNHALKADISSIRAPPEVVEFAHPTLELISKANIVPWSSFRPRRKHRDSIFVIDVLQGDPDIGFGNAFIPRIVRNKLIISEDLTHAKAADKVVDLPAHTARWDGQSQLPERIRINSKQLVRILEVIHKSRIQSESRSSFIEDSVVLLRPFRLLEYYDKAIRLWYNRLESELRETKEVLPEDDGQNHHGAAPATAQNETETPHADEVRRNEKEENEDESEDEGADDGDREGEDEGTEEDLDTEGLSRSPMALEHCRCLLDFINEYVKRKTDYLHGPRCEKVFYADLWYLFKPGDIALSASGKQAYQVISVMCTPHMGKKRASKHARYKEADESEKEYTHIECSYIHSDGVYLGPVSQTFNIPKFSGEKAVSSLCIYPLRFHILKNLHAEWSKNKKSAAELDQALEEGVAELRRRLVERGKMFVGVASTKHMFYSGLTPETHDDVEGQVMIDFTQAFTTEAGKDWCPEITNLVEGSSSDTEEDTKTCDMACCRNDCVHVDDYVEAKGREDFVNRMIADVEGDGNRRLTTALYPRTLKDIRERGHPLTDDEYLIMSYCAFGFVLRDRTWSKLDMDHVKDISDSTQSIALDNEADAYKTSFDHLVLPKAHKSMVLSLVSQHFRNKASQQGIDEQTDIVRGKGKGLIILLHGAPGVGKTTTAEGVAEKFKKPLFQLTCSDLGTTPSEVEESLQRNFSLASRWDCILLLDEADVFLSCRRREDFNRNGLVAVFLRVLEYYSGILFLTTNRIGDFDEAFSSRIHMSLLYRPLTLMSTVQVFTLNLNMIEARYKQKRRKIEIDRDEILEDVNNYWNKNETARWNGRQIRNACQTALALAEFDAQPEDSKYSLTVTPEAQDTRVKLKVGHFRQVSEAYLEFSQYLNAVYGANAETRASESGLRAVEAIFEAIKSGTEKRVAGQSGYASNLRTFNLQDVKDRAQAQKTQQAQAPPGGPTPGQPGMQPQPPQPPQLPQPQQQPQLPQPQQLQPQQPPQLQQWYPQSVYSHQAFPAGQQQQFPPNPGYSIQYFNQETQPHMGGTPLQASDARLSQDPRMAAPVPAVSVSGPPNYVRAATPSQGASHTQPPPSQ